MVGMWDVGVSAGLGEEKGVVGLSWDDYLVGFGWVSEWDPGVGV
jgi:hypothetical protein